VTYRIVILPSALRMILAVRDRRIRNQICDRIDGLGEVPEQQGKPLVGELSGLRSIRAAGQRYWVLYRVVRDEVQVLVLAVGRRRSGDRQDIYQLARRLVRLRLLDPDDETR
jgi:mRNA interferase RelE/StbE